MKRLVACLLAGCAWLAISPARAQEGVAGELYGSGVHAYFTGQYQEAHTALTAAINSGARDPRCYYFRGLNYLQYGRTNEARSDFTNAAALEYGDSAGIYQVDRALERIQGPTRQTIERFRSAARTSGPTRLAQDRTQRARRSDALQSEVLSVPAGPGQGRNVNELPPPEPPMKAVDDPTAQPPAEGDKPVAEDPPAAPPKAATRPAGPDPFAERNPFNESTPLNRPAPPPAIAGQPPMPPPPMPAAPPPAAAPPPPANAAADAGEAKPGATKALGNIFRKALGGLVPTVPTPELPFGLGGGQAPPPNPPQNNQP